MHASRMACVLVAACCLFACRGKANVDGLDNNGGASNGATDPGTNQQPNNSVEVNADVTGVPTIYLRRLSQSELDNTLEDLLGETTRPAAIRLPEDSVDPFDNNGENQRVSQALVEALEILATDVAERLVADSDRRDAVVGCTPSGADDAVCFEAFVDGFARQAFRRPPTAEERAGLVGLQSFAIERGDFYEGVKLVVQAALQMPGFVYHVQRGVPVEGRDDTVRLNQFEVASRLSYFLWGSMPDDALLNAAEGGQLSTSDEVRAQAERMLGDERARIRMQRFHAMWLGFHRFSVQDTIGDAMLAETNALIDRVVFDEKRNYFDLFTLGESFLNDELAEHYGLTPPGSAEGTWVDYTDSGRGGILSHATFLSVASKFGDTSPTQRGRLIRERLMCQKINPPPPDLGVDTDQAPTSEESNCKKDRYAAIADSPGCASCHNQMDPVGFGLENFDQSGQYRTTDVGEPNCTIEGTGELVGIGTFAGPRELGATLVESESIQPCVVRQLWQFATGGRAGASDAPTIRSLTESFEAGDYRFDQLILDLVSSESFLYRAQPEPEAL